MSRILFVTLLLLGITLSGVSETPADEKESLALFVQTLKSVDDPIVQAALLKGVLSGLDGRRNVDAPEQWSDLSTKLSKSENKEVRELVSRLSQIFGDKKAAKKALNTVQDKQAPLEERRRALNALLTQQNQEASKLLASLLVEPEIRLDAIRGYALVENLDGPKILLAQYEDYPLEHKKAVIETLATRKKYAESLLTALKKKQINKDAIPAHVARSLSLILGDSFSKEFGEVRQLSADRTKTIAKYKKILNPNAMEKADASKGRVIFNKTCASCHLLYGAGGKIGPDLTGSNRANLDYILLNSVDPSYDVPAAYKMVIIETADGLVLNGVIAEEDPQRIVLKTVQQPRLVVLKSDIEARQVSKKSMMPDGQLDKMSHEDVRNLIKYLQTTEQVEIAQ